MERWLLCPLISLNEGGEMKSSAIKLVISLSVTLAIHTVSYAHGEKKHDSERESFDPVTTEFGSYELSMADTMRFTPSTLEIKNGDVIKFIVANEGALQHEFVLGTPASLSEHAEQMIKFPNMEHEEPYMAHVDPGGHFQAGMRPFSGRDEGYDHCFVSGSI